MELRALDVAVVPQATQLLNATVRDNVPPAKRRYRAALATAAAAAAASGYDFVASLPDGLDSPIGENGLQLFGG